MTGIAFIFITVVMGVFAGNAASGEEPVMAMRGNPPDGSRPVNALTGMRQGGVGEALTAPGVEEPQMGREARPEACLRWKDTCVRAPRLVAGQALEVESAAGFGLAPRFVERRGDGAARLFELLLKELTVPFI
ncbi:MAG: hypothetical protein LBS30_05165 [Planctomycetota bacterium]|jgi:hypothetical protein|nr:hypothetical protein [Planctomycetota bacterium]